MFMFTGCRVVVGVLLHSGQCYWFASCSTVMSETGIHINSPIFFWQQKLFDQGQGKMVCLVVSEVTVIFFFFPQSLVFLLFGSPALFPVCPQFVLVCVCVRAGCGLLVPSPCSPCSCVGSPKTCRLTGDFELPVGVSKSVNGCLSLHISPVIDRWSVQGVARLSPNVNWDWHQSPVIPD